MQIFQMLTYFTIQYQKNYIHKYYHQPYQQSVLNKLSSSHGRYYFQNSNFHQKAQTLSLATDTVSCFPSSNRLILYIWGEMFAKYPSLNNRSLTVGHSFKYIWCPRKKATCPVCNSNHYCTRAFC